MTPELLTYRRISLDVVIVSGCCVPEILSGFRE